MGSSGPLQDLLSQYVSLDEIQHYYHIAVDYGILDTLLHPFDYADTLIRLGYEPFPPVEEHGLVYGRTLVLPGVTGYVYYLYMIDGIAGCYRSVVPYVAGALIYRHLSKFILDKTPFPKEYPDREPRLCVQFTDANVGHFARTRFWKLVANCVAIHVSYPFHVLAVRTMARFVTKEGYRPSVHESWLQELGRVRGFGELYAGCQAKLIKEIALAIISAGSFLALMKVLQLAKVDGRQADNLENAMEFTSNSIGSTYIKPYVNVSDIMIINQTDIPLGNPPFNEIYSSCWDCLIRLRKERRWKYSTGYFPNSRRPYFGPQEFTMTGGEELLFTDPIAFFGPAYIPNSINEIPYFLKTFYEPILQGSAGDGLQNNRGRGRVAMAGIKALFSDKPSFPTMSNLYYGTTPIRIAL